MYIYIYTIYIYIIVYWAITLQYTIAYYTRVYFTSLHCTILYSIIICSDIMTTESSERITLNLKPTWTIRGDTLNMKMPWCQIFLASPSPTVSFHNFKSQKIKLSVSNPKSKYVVYLSVLSQISNCQGLGRKNKHEIWKLPVNGGCEKEGSDIKQQSGGRLLIRGGEYIYIYIYIYVYVYTYIYIYIYTILGGTTCLTLLV